MSVSAKRRETLLMAKHAVDTDSAAASKRVDAMVEETENSEKRVVVRRRSIDLRLAMESNDENAALAAIQRGRRTSLTDLAAPAEAAALHAATEKSEKKLMLAKTKNRSRLTQLKMKIKMIGKMSLFVKRERMRAENKLRVDRIRRNWSTVRRIARASLAMLAISQTFTDSIAEEAAGFQNYEEFRSTIEKSVYSRNDIDAKKIHSVLKRLDFFKKFDPAASLELCRKVTLAVYNTKHDVVFRQGDFSDFFYVILFGSVVVSVRTSDGGSENVATLVTGDYFGELSLHNKEGLGNRRTATVLTLEPTQLLRIPSRDYTRIVKIAHDKTLKTRLDLIDSIPAFRTLSHSDRKNTSFLFRARKYFPGQVIFEQGTRMDETSYIVVVKRGHIRIMKRVHTNGSDWFPNYKLYPVPESARESRASAGVVHLIDPVELSQVAAHAKPAADMVLAQVGRGGVLLHNGILPSPTTRDMTISMWGNSDKSGRSHSARHRGGAFQMHGATCIAVTCVEVLVLSQKSVRRRMKSDFLEDVKDRLKVFPTGAKLKRLYETRKQWKQWRGNFIKKVLRSSHSFKAKRALRLLKNENSENSAWKSAQNSESAHEGNEGGSLDFHNTIEMLLEEDKRQARKAAMRLRRAYVPQERQHATKKPILSIDYSQQNGKDIPDKRAQRAISLPPKQPKVLPRSLPGTETPKERFIVHPSEPPLRQAPQHPSANAAHFHGRQNGNELLPKRDIFRVGSMNKDQSAKGARVLGLRGTFVRQDSYMSVIARQAMQ